jgi:hypothetical protein
MKPPNHLSPTIPGVTSGWRNLSLNPANAIPLFQSPRHILGNEALADRGTDLFVHVTPSGMIYFYLYHWSLYSNETNICQITSADAARDFILEHMGQSDHFKITDPERIRILEYFPGIFDSGN